MTDLATPLAIIGTVLILVGVPWWMFNYPSAERPASLFVVVGIIFIGVAGWIS